MAVVVTVAKGYDLGYIWKTQGQASAEHIVGGYYINAAQAGEPPGRWWGPGAQALGFAIGQVVEREPYDAVYQQVDPRTGAKLGRRLGRYPKFADHLARLKAAEPHATTERLIELEREAAQATRQPAAYTDVTVSFSKSISVLHASIRENARRARLAGDEHAAAYWAGREETFQEILHRANRTTLDYLQEWAGVTRTGYHGVRIDGQEPGRFEETGLIVTSWLQGTSRDGDPQDHIHNQIARITRTTSDGKWRAHDTASLRAVLGALQAVAATAVECELTLEFGVAWIPRADGRGNEIQGITQAQMDAYSTRTVQVREKEHELARAWQRKHGRAPTSRELLYIANDATLQSRKSKDASPIDWDALTQRWDATLGGQLASIAPAVSNARGPDATASAASDGPEQDAPPSREAQARAIQKALTLVSEKQPAWTRHDLLKQLALVLPPETRQMGPQAAQQLLLGLADEALSGRTGEVVCLEAPQWPPLPRSLRRDLDGRSVYTRPGTARYATAAQLSQEEQLVAHAQTQGAPRLSAELAARRLGADAELLAAQLRESTQDAREHRTPSGLRLDQAAAVWHVLTSARTVEVVTGPAGTGKTRVLAAAAQAWGGPVFGTATSQNATNELRKAGVRVTANTTRLLADLDSIPPGSLIVVDEGSMVSLAHLAALAEHATRHGCKLVLAGDQEQLAAVESGGAMMLLADRLGYVQLAEPVRFTAGLDITLRPDSEGGFIAWDQPWSNKNGTAHSLARCRMAMKTMPNIADPLILLSAAATRVKSGMAFARTVLAAQDDPARPIIEVEMAGRDRIRTISRMSLQTLARLGMDHSVLRGIQDRVDLERQTEQDARDQCAKNWYPPAGPLGPIRPIHSKNYKFPIGRGAGMHFLRELDARFRDVIGDTAASPQIYFDTQGFKRLNRKDGLYADPADVARSLKTMGYSHLRLVCLWYKDDTRLRMIQGLCDAYGLNPRLANPADSVPLPLYKDTVSAVFHEVPTFLIHGPEGGSSTGVAQVSALQQPKTGTLTGVWAETEFSSADDEITEADEQGTREARERPARPKDDEDAKPRARRTLARMGAASQFITDRDPSEKGEDHPVIMAQLDLNRSLGIIDRRIDNVMVDPIGEYPATGVAHCGIFVRRQSKRRGETSAKICITAAVLVPPASSGDAWTMHGWSYTSRQWQPYHQAQAAYHARDYPVGRMTELDADNQGYKKVARIIDQALDDLARYLNGIPYTVTVDGLATRRLWGGIHNNKQGQPGKPGTTWLPGHTLPLAQQPMAIIRVNKDTDETTRPIRVTRLSPQDEVIDSTETTGLMYRVETDFGNPVWLLVTVPPQYDGSGAGRLGDKKTRWTADYGSSVEGDLRRNEMRATWYAMNATEIYVIPIAKAVDCRALAKITARLCHQPLAWTDRTRYPAHLHAAEQMDLDHPQYRRSALGEDPEADSTGEPPIQDITKEEE